MNKSNSNETGLRLNTNSRILINQFSEKLIALSATSTGLGIISTWILSSYYDVNVVASQIWFGEDSWCRIPQESMGIHCFGDFHERVAISSFGVQPWPNNLELSPILPFLTMIWNFAGETIGMKILLYSVLICYFFLILIPLIWATNHKPLVTKLIVTSTLGLTSLPFLVALDRANFVITSTPIFLLFLISARRGNLNLLCVSILTLAAIKPQFLLLAVIFLGMRSYQNFVKTVGLSLAINSFLIVAAGKGDLGRLKQWFEAVFNASARKVFREDFPQNIGFSKGIYNIASAIDWGLTFGLRINDNHFFANFFESNSTFLQLSLYAILTVGLTLIATKIPITLFCSSLLVLSCIGNGNYIPGYYLLFIIPISAIAIRNPISSDGAETNLGSFDDLGTRTFDKFFSNLLMVCIVWSSSTLIVPISLTFNDGQNWGIEPSLRAINLLSKFTPLLWLLFLILVLLKPILGFRYKQPNHKDWDVYEIAN